MALFKVLAGQHIQKDKEGAPHTYSAGQTVESDVDLVAKLGANKFQLVSGHPEPFDREPQQSAAPGGQVSSGFQVSTTDKEGNVLTGPASAADAEKLGLKFDAEPKPALVQHSKVDLDSMTVRELNELAAQEGIDTKGAKTKDELVRAIRASERKAAASAAK